VWVMLHVYYTCANIRCWRRMTILVNNLIYLRFFEQNPQYISRDLACVFTRMCAIRVSCERITYILKCSYNFCSWLSEVFVLDYSFFLKYPWIPFPIITPYRQYIVHKVTDINSAWFTQANYN
jgi:hypothetical protein